MKQNCIIMLYYSKKIQQTFFRLIVFFLFFWIKIKMKKICCMLVMLRGNSFEKVFYKKRRNIGEKFSIAEWFIRVVFLVVRFWLWWRFFNGFSCNTSLKSDWAREKEREQYIWLHERCNHLGMIDSLIESNCFWC